MTVYAVGDLQGCLKPLKQLLKHVKFNAKTDELWLVGDLINRGPDSIGCLQFVKSLGDSAKVVLGNHDLHVIAHRELKITPKDKDIQKTLAHPEAKELFKWLRKQPLYHQDKNRKIFISHAGIPPVWKEKQAMLYAQEFQAVMANKDQRLAFFKVMYGDEPNKWSDELTGHDRLRYIVNAFTRMRFCAEDSTLDFSSSSAPKNAPIGMKPWFHWPVKRKHQLVFGHWAALMGRTYNRNIIGLDTGYVWGEHLTLMNLDTKLRYCCDVTGDITEYTELEFDCLPEPK